LALFVRLKESEHLPRHWDPEGSPSDTRELAPEHARHVLCVACRGLVTDSASRLEKNGSHAHTFVNPSGIVYRVGCFARSPGTNGVGKEREEFTWFPGFAWLIVVCRGCGAHLGWRFRARDSHFFALILERIVETLGPPSAQN
jgi:hypothetical protein